MENTNLMSFRSIIISVFRKKNIAIIISITGFIFTFVVLKFNTPMYTATAKLHIRGIPQVSQDFYMGLGGSRIHQTQMAIVRSDPVLRRVVETLHLDKQTPDYEKKFCSPIKYFLIDLKQKQFESAMNEVPEDRKKDILFMVAKNRLLKNLTTNLISGTDIFTIEVTDFSPAMAVAITNILSRAYTIFDQQQQLVELTQTYGKFHPSVVQLADNIDLMTKRLSGNKVSDFEALGTASVKIIEQANTDYQPVGRPKIQILLIGIIASICAGLGFAFVYDHFLDQTFKSPEQIINTLNLPLIGSVPKIYKKGKSLLISEMQTNYLYTLFLEDMADQLFVFIKTLKIKSILMSSTVKGEGCSSISSNLAILLSKQASCKTLLIDMNFANPTVSKLFAISNEPGIADILEINPTAGKNKGQLSDIIHHIDNNFDIITAGKMEMNPTALTNEHEFVDIINKLKEMYSVILVDSSNIKNNKYIEKLSQILDGTIIVISEGKVKKQIIENTLSIIRRKNVNVVGAILNNRKFPIPEFIYKRL